MIGVVVLTYAPAPGMLEACLASLRAAAAPDGEAVQVVLVDNGGVTATATAALLAALEHVEVVAPGENTGFARGMNLGARRSLELGARAVVILNDDTVVDAGWLGPLVGELDAGAARRVGAVQPKLLFADDPTRVNSLGVSLGHDGAGTDIGRGSPDDGGTVAGDLDIFTGGAVLLSADFVRDTGGFDERFFVYYEDVDLALRGAERGWTYRLAPASRVYHRGSATAPSIGHRTAYYRERNRLWVLVRHRPWRDVATGTWLSVRRLRWPPRRVHARALAAGLAAAPRLLHERRARPHRL